jgi:hypothetical protein
MGQIIIGEKDRALIVYNRELKKYQVKELTLHDKNTAELLKRVSEFIATLNAGDIPKIVEVCAQDVKYKCEECGLAQITAFSEHPERNRIPCYTCKKWTWHTKTRIPER